MRRYLSHLAITSAGSNFIAAGAIPGLFDSPSDILSKNRLLKFSEGDAAYNRTALTLAMSCNPI